MGDGLVVGTYLAEQVALTSYALLAVTQADAMRTQSQVPAVHPPHKVKRRLRDHSNFKADTLPALASLDPLLQSTGKEPEADETWAQGANESQRVRRHRLAQIEISSARLTEGRSTWATDRPNPEELPDSHPDCRAIASLTAPLPWFRPGASEGQGRKQPKKGRSRRGSRGFAFTDPWDLFSVSLRGTGVERSPKKNHSSSPRRGKGDRSHADFHHTLPALPLLPEDAVQAYFESEKARTEELREKERQKEEEQEAPNPRPEEKRRNAILKPNEKVKEVHRPTIVRETRKSEPTDPLLEGDAFERTKFFAELLDQMFVKQKFSQLRRDACQLTRVFVLGAVGNENLRNKKDRESVFFESCGTKEDMLKLLRAWDTIDVDSSGRIELGEIRSLSDRLLLDVVAAEDWAAGASSVSGKNLDSLCGSSRLPGWIVNTPTEERPRFVQRFCDKLTAVLTSARKQSFYIEDIMRLMWSCSSEEDLKQMRGWCEEINRTRDKWRVSPPPVLPSEEKAALQAVFNYFDKDGGGSISTNELILSGLIDKDYAKEFVSAVDADGSGEIDIQEFCEMMCPHGFRASTDSVMGSTPLGQAARLDEASQTWRLKEAPPLVQKTRRPSKGRAKEKMRPSGGGAV